MKLKKVEVIWVDSTSIKGWWNADGIKSMEIMHINTLGYLFSKDKEKITLVMSHDWDRGEVAYGEPFLIPRGCIKEIRLI